MFCLESREQMPAALDEIEEAEAEGIVVNCSWGPKQIIKGENGQVTAIEFKKCIQVKDTNGRFNPKYDEEDTAIFETDCIMTAIGQSVEWGELLDNAKFELNPNKTLKADGFTYQTSEPDVFVGGDVYTGARFAIDAIAAGKQGAESMRRYVWGGSLTQGRNRREYMDIDKENIEFGSYDNTDRQKPGIKNINSMSFCDNREVFTEEQVKKETARCLKCGASHVDENLCIGCAVCTTRCKFDAIHIRKVFDTEPVPREKLVSDVVKEIGRRKVWTTFHKPNDVEVPVGLKNDWTISKATGKAKKVSNKK